MYNMKSKLILLVFTCLTFTIMGQNRINYKDFPKNSISIAPSNIFFDGNGNTLFYKRILSRDVTNLKYLRIGTEFFGSYSKSNNSANSQNVSNYSLNIGLEKLKKLKNFSLSYGQEIALNYYSTKGKHVEPVANSIFLPQSIFSQNNPNIDRGTSFLTSLIAFIGIKYHFSEHFSIGLESAAGLGFYNSQDKLIDGTKSESVNGIITDMDASRQFTIEYHF